MPRLKGQANLQTYLNFIEDTGIHSGRVFTGRFYTYNYLFDKSRHDYKVLKYWDVFPLVFVYEQKGDNFFGLNFHHMGPRSRQIWMARARSFMGYLMEEDKRLIPLNDFQHLYMMFKKSTYGVRQYKKKRVRKLKRIPTESLDETMKFISNTYFGASVGAVLNNYKLYIPK